MLRKKGKKPPVAVRVVALRKFGDNKGANKVRVVVELMQICFNDDCLY